MIMSVGDFMDKMRGTTIIDGVFVDATALVKAFPVRNAHQQVELEIEASYEPALLMEWNVAGDSLVELTFAPGSGYPQYRVGKDFLMEFNLPR